MLNSNMGHGVGLLYVCDCVCMQSTSSTLPCMCECLACLSKPAFFMVVARYKHMAHMPCGACLQNMHAWLCNPPPPQHMHAVGQHFLKTAQHAKTPRNNATQAHSNTMFWGGKGMLFTSIVITPQQQCEKHTMSATTIACSYTTLVPMLANQPQLDGWRGVSTFCSILCFATGSPGAKTPNIHPHHFPPFFMSITNPIPLILHQSCHPLWQASIQVANDFLIKPQQLIHHCLLEFCK